MAQIKELDLGKLRQEESFGYHTLASAETAKCNDEKLKPQQAAYTSALSEFDAALKTGGASPFSEPITELDIQCDDAYSGLTAQIRNSIRHFDPDKSATGREADIIIRKYGNPCALPYLEEIGVLHNLIQELKIFDNHEDRPVINILKSSITSDRLTAIGAKEWLDRLETVYTLFVEAFTARNTAKASIVTGASTVARTNVDKAYRAVVKRINALAEVNGDTDYISVINAINSLIDRQKSVLAARKTTNAKKKNENDRPDIA